MPLQVGRHDHKQIAQEAVRLEEAHKKVALDYINYQQTAIPNDTPV